MKRNGIKWLGDVPRLADCVLAEETSGRAKRDCQYPGLCVLNVWVSADGWYIVMSDHEWLNQVVPSSNLIPFMSLLGEWKPMGTPVQCMARAENGHRRSCCILAEISRMLGSGLCACQELLNSAHMLSCVTAAFPWWTFWVDSTQAGHWFPSNRKEYKQTSCFSGSLHEQQGVPESFSALACHLILIVLWFRLSCPTFWFVHWTWLLFSFTPGSQFQTYSMFLSWPRPDISPWSINYHQLCLHAPQEYVSLSRGGGEHEAGVSQLSLKIMFCMFAWNVHKVPITF